MARDPLDYSARKLVADNVRDLMNAHKEAFGSVPKLAKAAKWPAGPKRGRSVSERQIRYLLDTRADAIPPTPSPTLDLIIAVANAFEVHAWQLLADTRALRIWEIGKLFDGREAVSDTKVEGHYPLPPQEAPDKARRGRK